jgi:hypothetical protein
VTGSTTPMEMASSATAPAAGAKANKLMNSDAKTEIRRK